YNEVLEQRPADKQILRMLGELYARIEDYTAAAKAYRAMFSDDPDVSREVMQRLEGLLSKIEGSIIIREILADIYMRSLMPDAAALKLREIIRLDPAKLKDAIQQLKTILKTYPMHPSAAMVLAEAFCLQGSFSEAAECYHELVKTKREVLDDVIAGYKDIIQLCPSQVLARIYLAEAYLQKGQVSETLDHYSAMLQMDPTVAETIIQKCREILKSQPQSAMAHLVLGKAYLVKGDFQRAATEAESIILADKKYAPAYLLLGEAQLNLKTLRKAADTFKQALLIDPYNQEAQEKFSRAKIQEVDNEIAALKTRLTEDPWKVSLHLDLAKLLSQKGMDEEAIRELQMALKDQTRAPFACNFLGCIYRGQGRYDLAAAQFNRALELTPPEIADFGRGVRFNLGSAYEAQGLVQKALKIYENILQEDIDFGGLKNRIKTLKATGLDCIRHKMLQLVLTQYGKGETIAVWGREGKSSLTGKKEEISVSFGQSHNTAGYEYYMKEMHKAAVEEFQLAVQLDGNYAAALNNWGAALVNENKLPEAIRRFEEVVRKNPASSLFRGNLGVACYLNGQASKARKEMETARELGLESSALDINLGDVYYFSGEIEKATRLYQRVGDFDPLKELAERRLVFKVPG
ncbi:MAG: tetratricopeptide repeat protein, partial [Candidatus Margulisbacteria bacterium]|nr:tetratricopeptide repeat protein [Candidatus Margulisiibacteriota bacterium]